MLVDDYEIRLANEEDLPRLPAIESAAAELFLSTDYAFLVNSEPISLDFLRRQQREGLVWVATEACQVVGFVVVRILDEAVYLHEIDVHPTYGRRGIGRRLILAVCQWAREVGYTAITLSTFEEVPWNTPFYTRLGFRILLEEELSPGLIEVRMKESQAGLPIERRVCMRLDI